VLRWNTTRAVRVGDPEFSIASSLIGELAFSGVVDENEHGCYAIRYKVGAIEDCGGLRRCVL
jgi:hypothetical protein